jgi:plasmid stability protein
MTNAELPDGLHAQLRARAAASRPATPARKLWAGD